MHFTLLHESEVRKKTTRFVFKKGPAIAFLFPMFRRAMRSHTGKEA